MRSTLFGRDDWLVPMDAPLPTLANSLDDIEDKSDIEYTFKPFDALVGPDLHRILPNWIDHMDAMASGGFEQSLAIGWGWVGGRTRPWEFSHPPIGRRCHFATAVSRPLPFRGAGVCRIVWGISCQLGDCRRQDLPLAPLAFRAIDFGDTIRLGEFLQRQLASAEREGRSQCTLIALASGISALPNLPLNIPAKFRVAQLALELRIAELAVDRPFFESPDASCRMGRLSLIFSTALPTKDTTWITVFYVCF